MMKKIVFLPVVLLLLQACSAMPVEIRVQQADRLAATVGWEKHAIPAGKFSLVAYSPDKLPGTGVLKVYIEGDGYAWRNRRTPSSNPTPVNPMALKLAIQEKSAAVYLARPCQYVQAENSNACDPRYWAQSRFSEEVIAASDKAISELARRFQAEKLVLVGYSGGGAVATLLAARRDDVSMLVTIAGNLDHRAWTQHHDISPLSDSLNPVDNWKALQSIPQLHLVGKDDRIIPPDIADAYVSAFEVTENLQIRVIKDFDHHCCWSENWSQLLKTF